ncbi:hypothetical protein HBH98_112070 [Parastagonospora nodorum]|nr:hypothetical protein HBH52_064970 [Parastagonospora nodorum]KAH3985821.1 hypothetical protein HBH51_023760 [Parastagonospora nodorum]KAH4106576.1 hypothetical protein HBH46_071780 [Parastagonospora nodorum]KAH4129014.1 hypothetical protein HBH47_036260 [Parastagonospora nodorum]KAH4210445.1 hypothetical protein HBI95_059600 [Parastagonospora nodorum]
MRTVAPSLLFIYPMVFAQFSYLKHRWKGLPSWSWVYCVVRRVATTRDVRLKVRMVGLQVAQSQRPPAAHDLAACRVRALTGVVCPKSVNIRYFCGALFTCITTTVVSLSSRLAPELLGMG